MTTVTDGLQAITVSESMPWSHYLAKTLKDARKQAIKSKRRLYVAYDPDFGNVPDWCYATRTWQEDYEIQVAIALETGQVSWQKHWTDQFKDGVK